MNSLSISLLMSLALRFGYRLPSYQVLPLQVLLTAPKGLKSLCRSTFYSRWRHHCPSRMWRTFQNDTKGVCGCSSVFPGSTTFPHVHETGILLVNCEEPGPLTQVSTFIRRKRGFEVHGADTSFAKTAGTGVNTGNKVNFFFIKCHLIGGGHSEIKLEFHSPGTRCFEAVPVTNLNEAPQVWGSKWPHSMGDLRWGMLRSSNPSSP